MTRFASFIANQQDGQTPVSINPARVVAVIAVLTPNGRASEFSAIEVGDRVIEVVGSVAEVVAALESATAPPVAAAVEVEPTDLEIAAKVMEEVAGAISDDGDRMDALSNRIHNTIGNRYDRTRWDGAINRLQALAAKLRGGG